MEFDLDADQRALRDAARAFLERETPISYARAMMDDERGWRDDVWGKMADLGWMGLPFSADVGGVGQGFVALAILLSEMGRVVLPGPYFSTVVLAGSAIDLAGSDAQRKEFLPQIAAGELQGTFASGNDSSRGERSVKDRVFFDVSRLNGEMRFVMDAASADFFVIPANSADGPSLYVTRGREGVKVEPVKTLDQTRRVGHVRLERTPADRLDRDPDAIRRVLDRACAGLAAEMLGGVERVTELAVSYAKQRVQFDRPIGSFQAVKHRAADMLMDVESLRNAVYYAAWAIERDHPDASLAASMAKAYASDVARRVSASGIQVHGGIGFTWDHDMHIYFKRAKASEQAFGSADFHRERMADLLEARYGGGRRGI